MDAALGLYNAARRYCIDKRALWLSQCDAVESKPEDLVSIAYRDNVYAKVPRFHLLHAILMDIESIDSDALPEYSALKELLMLSAATAVNQYTREPRSRIEKAAIEDERRKFADEIGALTAASIVNIQPLPYRRVLSPGELSSMWERLGSRWGADGRVGWFYPLSARTDPSLLAFDNRDFFREFPPSRLRTLFLELGIQRLYEIRDVGDRNFLLAIDALEPLYDGTERYWCTDSLDWIMYASHHDTMTTGGSLTPAIQSLWKGPGMPELES